MRMKRRVWQDRRIRRVLGQVKTRNTLAHCSFLGIPWARSASEAQRSTRDLRLHGVAEGAEDRGVGALVHPGVLHVKLVAEVDVRLPKLLAGFDRGQVGAGDGDVAADWTGEVPGFVDGAAG